MALINVSGLSFAYESTPVLQNVNLSVAPGEKLAILGGNGSGKSTLAQWIAGTPEILPTIALSLTLGSAFNVSYALGLWRAQARQQAAVEAS